MLPKKGECGISHTTPSRNQGTSTTGKLSPKRSVLLIRERVTVTPNIAKATGVNPIASSISHNPDRTAWSTRYNRAEETAKITVKKQCFTVPTFFSKLPAKYQTMIALHTKPITSLYRKM